jgi:penicillin-binding protein 1A
VRLSEALAMSLNTVAVRLGLEVGARTVVRTAQRLGINSPLQANASIALGTSEVTPLELVSAYAPFANGGIGVVPRIIENVKSSDGKRLFQHKHGTLGKVVEPRIIAQMNGMMRDTLLIGTARKADFTGWEAAGKTGTTQDFRDAWFVGYTSHLVAGVWLGNDDSSATKKLAGSGLPVEVWSRFMKAAHAGVPRAPLPGGPFYGGQPSAPAFDPTATTSSNIPANQFPNIPPTIQPDPQEKTLFERLFQ